METSITLSKRQLIFIETGVGREIVNKTFTDSLKKNKTFTDPSKKKIKIKDEALYIKKSSIGRKCCARSLV